jgi:hypothetical protein
MTNNTRTNPAKSTFFFLDVAGADAFFSSGYGFFTADTNTSANKIVDEQPDQLMI